MTTVGWCNLLALTVALAVALAGGVVASPAVRPAAVLAGVDAAPTTVRDARGTPVVIADYRRMVSLGLAEDAIAGELLEPQRLVGVSAWSLGPYAWRLAGRTQLSGLDDTERILGLRPDLVVCPSAVSDAGRVQRLRAAGCAVFDCGEARGIDTFLANLVAVGTVVGAPQRAERAAAAYRARLAAIVPPPGPRRRGLYLAPIAGQLFGGAAGTSYHDVLVHAGVDDCAAAAGLSGWPQYATEQLIALAPDLIVTRHGLAADLRRLPGFARLPAAARADGVIEIDAGLIEDPGLAIPDAAAALAAALTSPPAIPRPRP